ncbi:MAG: peptidoglycan DD-metalloendopeptidase family protein [Rubrobacteraceae bacterium]
MAHLLVPLWLILDLWRRHFESRISWLASVLGFGAYILYIFLAGQGWDWVSYYLRGAIPVAFAGAVYVSFRRVSRTGVPWWSSPGSLGGWASLLASMFLIFLFGWSTALAAQGFSYGDQRAAELSYPLEGGVWYVAHGGDNPVLNYHNVDRAQRFAVDLVKLNPLGTRTSGVYPSDPRRYAAFGAQIESPCTGEVIEAQDGNPDHRGSGTDRENPAGNHVVMRCQNTDPEVDVVLAHMKRGSVMVEQGEVVEEEKALGKVGNSGNTSEPHLHIHAVKTGSGNYLEGKGVPIEFNSRFLVRNSLVFRG